MTTSSASGRHAAGPITGLPAAERRERILTLLQGSGFVKVSQLVQDFGVTEVTIRSDLDAIGAEHDVHRVHGGAVARTTRNSEASFEESLGSNAEEKRRIGITAAALVSDGDTVILDVGTTPTAVAEALLEREELSDVTIITNSLTIALTLEAAIPRFTVIVSGGTLRPRQHSLVAPYATTLLDGIHADLAIIGCTGVHPRHGVTNINLPETELKRAMIARADRTVIVADSSKIGASDRGRVAAIDEVWALVTDDGGDHDRDDFGELTILTA